MSDIKRGEIYYIDIPYATGHEMEKDRPGIIVSCDDLNKASPVVAVVMCSASCKHELPEHITIRSTPVQSNALCEHIYTVDKSRAGRRVGRCTKSEMAAVDIGLMAGLGLGQYDLARPCIGPGEQTQGCDSSGETDSTRAELGRTMLSLIRAETERDTYKALYEGLLDRMTIRQSQDYRQQLAHRRAEGLLYVPAPRGGGDLQPSLPAQPQNGGLYRTYKARRETPDHKDITALVPPARGKQRGAET